MCTHEDAHAQAAYSHPHLAHEPHGHLHAQVEDMRRQLSVLAGRMRDEAYNAAEAEKRSAAEQIHCLLIELKLIVAEV